MGAEFGSCGRRDMAEPSCRSKLKRKKSSVEELRSDTSPRWRDRAAAAGPRSAHTDGCGAPAVSWWSRRQLPAVERLWALTLKSAVGGLEDQRWDPLPDLPHPCAARPSAVVLEEQRWCDLSGDIPPLPEPSPTSTSSEAVRLPSSQEELSEHTGEDAHPAARSQSPGRRPPQQQPAPHRWEEQEEERGGVSRQLQTDCVSDTSAPLQREGDREEGGEGECRSTTEGEGGGGGAGGLQSCPMCLQVFPSGSTQIDCDSHLAQCLSDMNVDMTW